MAFIFYRLLRKLGWLYFSYHLAYAKRYFLVANYVCFDGIIFLQTPNATF
ncbi:MAG: hypothetical protein MUC29_03070 [Pyrinomonadaceae bacterium]|nr:hypothetical protein [Pyrinomonadaceae bacterium]